MTVADDLLEVEKAISDKSTSDIFAERYPDAPPEAIDLKEFLEDIKRRLTRIEQKSREPPKLKIEFERRIEELDESISTIENSLESSGKSRPEDDAQMTEKEAYLRKLVDPQ